MSERPSNIAALAASHLAPPSAAPVPLAARLLMPQEEALVFWRLHRSTVFNHARQALLEARLRLALVACLTGLLWVALFALFAEGFQFLKSAITEAATHDETVRAIFSIFFASLMVMLVLSTGIIAYGGLFRSAEAGFLLTTPARTERVFLHKFQEAMLFASWGFLLLGSPLLVAYGVVEDAGWYYFAVLVPFMLSFVFIPGTLGAMLALAIVRWMPKNRGRLLWLGGAVAGAAVLLLAWRLTRRSEGDLLTPGWFQEMLARLRFSEYRLLPSWWFSSGLLEAAHASWREPAARLALTESAMFLSLTISNALVLHLAALWLAGRIYRAAYSALQSEGTSRKRIKQAWADRAASWAACWLGPQMRLLIVKDLRLFRRDPIQWLQFLIFFGLLALYFLNIRRLSYDLSYLSWVNMISFLNLAVVGLILSTFTTRFIFPMISLEGRRFWILGLLPVRRDTILWSKYLFATAGSIVPSTLLVLLNDAMLRVSAGLIVVHLLVCIVLCSGLAGLAVGLGAKMPSLREDSPSRIAAGFGGTLNLVIGTAYIAAVVLLTAVPCHFYLAARQGFGAAGLIDLDQLWRWLVLGTAASVGLGIITTVVPLWLGIKAFRAMEF